MEQKFDRAELILTLFGFTMSKGHAELEDVKEEVEIQHKKQVTILQETVRDFKQWPCSDRITQRGVMETVKKRDQEDFIHFRLWHPWTPLQKC